MHPNLISQVNMYFSLIILLPFLVATANVQDVGICHISNESYFIQCTYLEGSNVRGCIYILSSNLLGVENVTGMIGRNSTPGAAVDPAIFGFFNRLLATEWRYDNENRGKAPIHILGSLPTQSVPMCMHEVTTFRGM